MTKHAIFHVFAIDPPRKIGTVIGPSIPPFRRVLVPNAKDKQYLVMKQLGFC